MSKRLVVLAVLLSATAAIPTFAAESPPTSAAPSIGIRYVDKVFPTVDARTGIQYATAPSLTTGAPEALLLDSYTPVDDTNVSRPAIVFIHGGGFRFGNSASLATEASAYAQRGYVTFSINYRLDPDNGCDQIPRDRVPDPSQNAVVVRCTNSVLAAQHDSQASIRWIRANAAGLGVDPSRVAVIGFSAGAVTAVRLAYRADQPGDVGDHLEQSSAVQAGISAAGCDFVPDAIGPGDAPMFFLHAEFDIPVPFSCALENVKLALAAGLVADTMFYYGESTHARSLYLKYQFAVDARWTAFLIDQLDLGNLVAAGSQTVIHGVADRSGVVSIVMTGNRAPGYVQVLPCGSTPGASSNLNTDAASQTRAGLAVVHFDAKGEACLFNQTETHLVADLQGYFAAGAIDDVADVRLIDSRLGAATPVAGGSQTRLSGRPNSTAIVSVVADQTAAAGFLQVLECGSPAGTASNLNSDRPGQTIANLAFVRFDSAGHVCVFNQSPTHLVVDLQAYLADSTFADIADVRALDTRSGPRPAAGSQTTVAGGVSSTAVVSLIATSTSAPGYVQALPCGDSAGGSSNVNADRADQTIANLAFVRFGPGGTSCLFTSAAAHLVADVQGYLAAGSFDDVADTRLLDTRLSSGKASITAGS